MISDFFFLLMEDKGKPACPLHAKRMRPRELEEGETTGTGHLQCVRHTHDVVSFNSFLQFGRWVL